VCVYFFICTNSLQRELFVGVNRALDPTSRTWYVSDSSCSYWRSKTTHSLWFPATRIHGG